MKSCTIEGCDKPLIARGLCGMHYKRLRDGRDLNEAPKHAGRRFTGPTDERFWHYVDKGEPDECWEWTSSILQGKGYGLFKLEGNMVRAHRMSWQLTNGPIPAGLLVCHKCDNPPCVNPAHLFLGTGFDNMRDMVAKGRHRLGGKLPSTQEAA